MQSYPFTSQVTLIPAHAGVIPIALFYQWYNYAYPRARGGDPVHFAGKNEQSNLSPRTRG